MGHHLDIALKQGGGCTWDDTCVPKCIERWVPRMHRWHRNHLPSPSPSPPPPRQHQDQPCLLCAPHCAQGGSTALHIVCSLVSDEAAAVDMVNLLLEVGGAGEDRGGQGRACQASPGLGACHARASTCLPCGSAWCEKPAGWGADDMGSECFATGVEEWGMAAACWSIAGLESLNSHPPLLLQAGLDPNTTDEGGHVPLTLAAAFEHKKASADCHAVAVQS